MTSPIASREARLLVVLAAILISSAVVAELVSVKLFQVRFYAFLGVDTMFTLTAGSILWPLVFLTTDVVNEFFGRRAVRFITWLTVVMIAWTFVASTLAIQVPAADFSPVDDAAFAKVFGQSAWIIVGSMAAFTLAQLVDVAVFHRIRAAFGGDLVWARATGSTIVSQLIDSFVVIYIAFWLPAATGLGQGVSAGQAMEIALSSFAYKVGVAILVTPLIYATHALVHRVLGDEVATRMAEEAAATS